MNNLLYSLLAFVALGQLITSDAYAVKESKVEIGVYYESLCPYSIQFIVDQIGPTFEELGHYLEIKYNPYGNAHDSSDEQGGYTFTCQHGNRECQGNLYQACLLDKLSKKNIEPTPSIVCIMGSPKPDQGTKLCMTSLQIEDPSYEDVDACHSSTEGQNLLHEFGVETDALTPHVRGVPWVTFNGVWTEASWNSALSNLRKYLCQEFLSDKPECQGK